ncbi:hypothetical protein FJZ28_02635 [Candidatus Peregrinibacteria bacterium]|nr:hypothetical protein [Candidatus Peregrinibacteria bacterium]
MPLQEATSQIVASPEETPFPGDLSDVVDAEETAKWQRGEYIGSIVQRVLDGDEEAWKELYREQWRPVFNKIMHMTRDPDLAEEIAQQVWQHAHRKIRSLRNPRAFCSWIQRVANNMTLNFLQR